MISVSYKKEVNGKVQDGYENFLSELFIPNIVFKLLEEGYTDIKIEKH